MIDLQTIGIAIAGIRKRLDDVEAGIVKLNKKIDRIDLAVIDTIVTVKDTQGEGIFRSEEEVFGPLHER
jgi:hypothetical protein